MMYTYSYVCVCVCVCLCVYVYKFVFNIFMHIAMCARMYIMQAFFFCSVLLANLENLLITDLN